MPRVMELVTPLGEDVLLFHSLSGRESMSRLFEHSPNIWETFARIGREAGAALVTFDDEQGELVAVWPRRGRLGVCVVYNLM